MLKRVKAKDSCIVNVADCLKDIYTRPPLKIMLFPVHRAGELISGEYVHFFHVLKIFLFSQHFQHYFYTAEKTHTNKKEICGLPTGHYYGHPQETNFFLGWPYVKVDVRTNKPLDFCLRLSCSVSIQN